MKYSIYNPLKIRIVISLLAIFFAQFTFSQTQNTGNIEGKIFTSDNKPGAFVNVIIENTLKGSVSKSDGTYEIKNIPVGNYTITYSLIGLEAKSIEVTIAEGTTTEIEDIILNINEEKLQEVVIIAQRLNQFAQKESAYVSRLPLKNINTPQSYTVVTNELLKEQLTTDLPTALKSITGGGYVQSNEGNVTAYLRGFRSDGYIRNGMVSYTRTPIDPQNIERIEVIKGTSSALFGSGFQNIAGYGGVLNRVSKKPFEGEKLEFSYTTGNWELNRVTADFNTVLDKENKLLFRVNGAFHTENSFQDQGLQRDYMIAPSLTYNINEKLSITTEVEFFKTRRNFNFASGLGAGVTNADSWDDLNWDFDNYYSTDDMAGEMKSRVFQTFIDYKVNDHWTSKTSFSSSVFDVEANFFRLEMEDNNTLSRNYIQYMPRNAGNTHIQQDFIALHKFGSADNKLLVGGSYINYFDKFQRAVQPGPPFIEFDQITLNGNQTVIPAITNDSFETFISNNFTRRRTQSKQEVVAAYLSDAITFNDKITVVGGIRFDRFINGNTANDGVEGNDGYNQNTIGYKLGAVYNPFNDKASLFVNYMNGFNNQAPGLDENGDVAVFDAEEATQWEIGTKFNLLHGKLKSTISYYNIDISNAIRNFGTYQVQDGETSSKGFEIDVIANPLPGLNLVAGFTHNEATVEKSANPSLEGKRLTLTPETVFNFWVSHTILNGNFKGLGFGVGANHMSEIYESRSFDNTFFSEAFTTFDSTIFYKKEKYSINLKIDNMFDEEYYNGYGIPQKPINFKLGISYRL